MVRYHTHRNQELTWFNFDSLTPNDVELVGYLQGERVDKKESVTLSMFDSVSFLGRSVNDPNRKEFIHAIGYLKKSKTTQILILREI